MADIQLFSAEELADQERKRRGKGGRRRSEERQRIIDQYKVTLLPAQVGWGGDVVLSEDDDKRLVRQNLKIAAKEIGKLIEFRPIKDSMRIRFRIITPEEQAAKPRRPGRPRKNPVA